MTHPTHLTPLPRFGVFSIVGVSGFAAQTGLLALLTRLAGWHYSVAVPVTAEATILASFACHARWTWPDRPVRGFRSATSQLARYQLAKATALGASYLRTVVLVSSMHLPPEAANAVAVGALALASFTVVDRLISLESDPQSPIPDPRSPIPDPQKGPMIRRTLGFFTLALATTGSAAVPATDLQSRTAAAFDRYVAETERQTTGTLVGADRFLWVDAQSAKDRQAGVTLLRSGGLVIERLETRSGEGTIDAPGGMIHHWLGAVFVPGASLNQAVALLQDYDRHAQVYKPVVARSRLLERTGDDFHVFLRFSMKKVVTVVVNSEHQARFTRASATRAYSRISSTRIVEVENPDTPQESERPVGRDGGYLWRLNSYWRFLERDGGTYVQCETITLSRGIPFGLGWIVGPFVTSVPRESLEFTLQTTRGALLPAPATSR